MARDGRDVDELRRQEESTREGLITYRRKKRARPFAEEDEVQNNSPHKERTRDIGWTHGEVVNGNRFHWRCKWCGLIRFGGGVSRLKKHLAGVCHVKKCPKVPEDVADSMRNHLLEKQKEREKKTNNHSGINLNSPFWSDDDFIKKDHMIDLDRQEENIADLTDGTTQQNKITLTKSFGSHKSDKKAHKGIIANLARGGNKHGILFQKSRDSQENVIKVRVGRNKRQTIILRSSGSHRNGIENHAGNTAGISSLQVGNATVLNEGNHIGNVTKVDAGTNKNDEVLVERCKNDLSNDMGFQLGTATRFTEGAHGRHGTGFTDGGPKKGKIAVKKSRSYLKSEEEPHMNRVSKLIKNTRLGSAPGLTKEAIRQSQTVIQNFNSDHSNGMEICGDNATQFDKGFIKQAKGTVHRSRVALEQSNTDDLLEHGIVKVRKDNNTIPITNLYEQDHQEKINSHWSNILKNTLELPDISQGDGILNCIHGALTRGPVFARKTGMTDQPSLLKNRYISLPEEKRPGSSMNGSSCASGAGTSTQTNSKINTEMCQKLLLKVLRSENFVLLCDLLCENFQDVKAKSFFDFNLINSKIKNGAYEHSPSLFNHDMVQVWEKFINVGRQMVILASSLSNMSQDSYQEQVVEGLVHEVDEYCDPKEACVVAETKKSMEPSQFTVCNSDGSVKPDEIEMCCMCRAFTRKQCDMEANGEGILICHGCEVRCHLSCVDPTIKEIPVQSWYCSVCRTCDKELPKTEVAHANKMVRSFDSTNIPDSRMQCDDSRVSLTAMSYLCKICGSFEDKDQKFLVCDNVHCLYKFYHIRCLEGSQIASPQHQRKPCWYCPYCLCRACLTHKDDDKIVLCDDCNEAYHIYCMNPPLPSIPKGQWYCVTCDVARAIEGMKRHEQWALQQFRKDDVAWSNEVHRSLDLLVRAAETLQQL